MNNLKLRVFNKKLNKMFQHSDILSINLADNKIITISGEELSYSEDETTSESILMFGIGKKDFYGKDLFDGDIVEYIDYYCYNGNVLEETHKGFVLYDEEDSGYSITHRSLIEMYNIRGNNIKILGNIYENNELFEEIAKKSYFGDDIF